MVTQTCKSCGMPMETTEQYGGENPLNPYCTQCTDQVGNLTSYDDVLKGMTQYMITTMKLEYGIAEKTAKAEMIKHPAWKAYAKRM